MKVVCVDNVGYKKYLTIDKIYETDDYNEFRSIVNILLNDSNDFATYNKELFKPLDEYRKNKIDKLLK